MLITGLDDKQYKGYMDARTGRVCDQENVKSICLMLQQNKLEDFGIPAGIRTKVCDYIHLPILEVENTSALNGIAKTGKGTIDTIGHITFESLENRGATLAEGHTLF